MSVYAVGDVQGCYDQLRRLLDLIEFEPGRDQLWLAGDIVNRGPRSLEVMRYVRGLGDAAVMVLGNHDLHLLALSMGKGRMKKKDYSLKPILDAKDRPELMDWLRHRPLMHHCPNSGFNMIHAGLPPQWDIASARARAHEVEQMLRSDRIGEFLGRMYGNEPNLWRQDLSGWERLRFITNCFTRLRYCDASGALALEEKGAPGSQQPHLRPWFDHEERASRAEPILFGHWSTLGYHHSNNVWALDTGCLWGGSLTALKLRKRKPPAPYHLECPGYRNP